MRSVLLITVAALGLGACQHRAGDEPQRSLSAVHVPVVTQSDVALDLSAPGGSVSEMEAMRLDQWLQAMRVGYGDTIYVDGADSAVARGDVARVVGQYGLLVGNGAPVSTGPVEPGRVRVIVSRAKASVPGCPDWQRPAAPNAANYQMTGFGCGVNSALAAMVANPNDLVAGRPGDVASDGFAASKAIIMYRDWPLTAIQEGQQKRPLRAVDTREKK